MTSISKDARARFKELRASLRMPIVVAPMFLVSGPDIVTASARAGVIGAFPSTNARTIDIFEEWLDRISDEIRLMREKQLPGATDVWAQNLIVHSTYERLDAELALLQKYRPQIVTSNSRAKPRTRAPTASRWCRRALVDIPGRWPASRSCRPYESSSMAS
jgi:NAD(P)H-dependent flavin oxidoreductase YrpB (nitropropane dioxygenase family)